MDITPLIPKNKKILNGYGNGIFKVNNDPYSGNIIICPDAVIPWEIENISLLDIKSLQSILNLKSEVELLVIGCGSEHVKLPLEIIKAFREKNISVEVMTTGAACRTYNVLLSEGRQLAAALIAV